MARRAGLEPPRLPAPEPEPEPAPEPEPEPGPEREPEPLELEREPELAPEPEPEPEAWQSSSAAATHAWRSRPLALILPLIPRASTRFRTLAKTSAVTAQLQHLCAAFVPSAWRHARE